MAEIWAFVDGVKTVGGTRIPLVKSKTYLSSNGSTIYTRCWWADRTQSCNCPGWTIEKKDKRTKEKLPRTCGHIEGKKESFAVENGVTPSGGPLMRHGFKVESNNRIIGSEE
jgi:hypothetical protein